MRNLRLDQYLEYLQIKGYSRSSIRGLMAGAWCYEAQAEKQRDYLKQLRARRERSEIMASTYNHYLYGVKSYLKFLEIMDQSVPEIRLIRDPQLQTRTEILSTCQVRRLFVAASLKPELEKRDRAALGCLYHLGLRASEATRLKPSEIDLKQRIVFVSRSKTGYQRRVPMSSGLEKIFLEYLALRPVSTQGAFLQGLKGDLTADGIAQIVKRLAAQAGISQRVYPHLFRHSIASHLLQRGMSLKQLSRFLGHKSLESTQRYTHLIEEGK